MKTIGIIGGSGYVGFSLARHLSREFKIVILDVNPPKIAGTAFKRVDVRAYGSVCRAVRNVDLVIHTAIVQIPLINEQKRLGYEVNVVGTQNVCRAVEDSPGIKGMILAGSWHTIGEKDIVGVVDEEFGLRPDKVEDRARLYALSKVTQESIVRIYDEMSSKTFGIIRMGTVLGEGMPESTAASMFIERGIKGEPITPFAHSMYRPMLYVDIEDVCKAYELYASKMLDTEHLESGNSLAHIVNVYYPKPVTILRLAEIVRNTINSCSRKRIQPRIEIVDKKLPISFDAKEIGKIHIDISKAKDYLGIEAFRSPEVSIRRIVKKKLKGLLQ